MISRVLILNFPKISIEAPPLASALLCALCTENNVDYGFIDCNVEFNQQLTDDLKNEILGLYSENFVSTLSAEAQAWVDQYFNTLARKCADYDLIAISVFSDHSVPLVNEFLSKHRNKFSAKVVIGGAGISSFSYSPSQKFYDYLYANALVDYWVLGEGEVGFTDILKGNLPSSSVNNHTFNHLDNFDLVPLPNLDKIKVEDYLFQGRRIIGVEGSRGCVRRCTFCDIQNTWGAYKYKDGQVLAKEILTLKDKYNIDHFWFNDSLINGSLKAFRDFIAHLAANRKDNFTWSSQAIVRSRSAHDEDDFRMLKDSGCQTLAVGIESFSEPVRFHMGKKFTDADIERFFELAQKYNISMFLLMIVGYPTETQQDFEYGLKQLEKYQHLADDGTITGIRVGGTMQIGPGLPIYHMRQDIGLKYNDDTQYRHVNWSVGNNTLRQRVEWRVEFEDYARHLGYNCADKEMHVEHTLLNFFKAIE